MDKQLADEIIACLPNDRTKFYYQSNGYALQLLKYLVGEGALISDLKKSNFGHLLNKPLIKKCLARAGKGVLKNDDLWFDSQIPYFPFVLTLTTWGDKSGENWQQTSRPGTNLVLQLNFSNQHEQAYKRMMKPATENLFNFCGHPVLNVGDKAFFRHTLAWSRIDLCFDSGEALIEEIQSDWCSEISVVKKFLFKNSTYLKRYWDIRVSGEVVLTYIDEILSPYIKLWNEAMLSAVIAFIYEEIGIDTIYYHSFETGYKLKRIDYSKPPRSLYTKLPSKFGFSETSKAPQFIQNDKVSRRKLKRIENPRWYVMHLFSVGQNANLQSV